MPAPAQSSPSLNRPYPCCNEAQNLDVSAPREINGGVITVETCKVCGRKHHVMEVDLITFGLVCS
jgi:hypothetical protein